MGKKSSAIKYDVTIGSGVAGSNSALAAQLMPVALIESGQLGGASAVILTFQLVSLLELPTLLKLPKRQSSGLRAETISYNFPQLNYSRITLIKPHKLLHPLL